MTHPMSPQLIALAERVWGTGDDGSCVQLSTASVPDGHRVVERYTVIPSMAKPRFLVPMESNMAAINSFRKYNAMRSRRTRAGRAALAAAFQSGLARRVFRDQLMVTADRRLSQQELAEQLVLVHLADQLDLPRVLAAISVRRISPNSKPTLQLFSPDGGQIGYAKLGWSPATRAMVQSEASTLEAVSGRLKSVIAPRVMITGTWRDRLYAVTRPLPEPVGRWTAPPARAPQLILEVAHSGDVARQPLAGSVYERSLRRQLDDVGVTAETRILSAWLDRLAGVDVQLEFGRWHGDWVSWNMGRAQNGVTVWDWEHSAPLVPVGFDALHWYFQHTLPARGIDASVAAVDDALADLSAVGVQRGAARHVSSLYLLEMFVRSVRLARGGGGWNPLLHPQMLTVAERRGD